MHTWRPPTKPPAVRESLRSRSPNFRRNGINGWAKHGKAKLGRSVCDWVSTHRTMNHRLSTGVFPTYFFFTYRLWGCAEVEGSAQWHQARRQFTTVKQKNGPKPKKTSPRALDNTAQHMYRWYAVSGHSKSSLWVGWVQERVKRITRSELE
ncbi:hypothetical protein H4582DRAFT_2042356 [Lactarius indigo]|nr:hypothetical protein H4582DRAFT_2042356 [Lactarius indigo]